MQPTQSVNFSLSLSLSLPLLHRLLLLHFPHTVIHLTQPESAHPPVVDELYNLKGNGFLQLLESALIVP